MNLSERLTSQLDAWPAVDRRGLLLIATAIGSFNTLLFYWLPWSGFDQRLSLLGLLVFLSLACVIRFFDALDLAAHALIGLSFAMLVPMVSQTGGINSPNIVWMPVLPMAALLLLNARWSLLWMGIILLHNLGQFLAVQQGWIQGQVNPLTMPLTAALLTKVNILFFLLLALAIYDLQYRQKMREVRLRNAELEATQAALLDAQTHKDEFIASVGHELRTPMNAILGLNGVLQDELADQAPQAQAAQHIRDATSQLLRVVNDILDISQLEAGRLDLHLAPCALAHAVLSSVHAYQAKAQAKGLTLSLALDAAPECWVLTDRQRLVQVMNHLLDNAVKFTAAGTIEVRASYAQGHFHFSVQDTGPGFAPQAFASLFNRFSNASLETKRTNGGAGLGLAVSYRLVKLAAGQIAARADPGQGACFWFDWPMALHSGAAPPVPARARGLARKLRFLIVDDHPMNQMVVQLLLRKRWPDCEVAVAQSAQSALQLLESSPCDLVLMDVYMPDMDGVQATLRLRAHAQSALRSLAVIGLTANQVASEVQRCLAAGMQTVVFKPIDQALFFTAVAQALGEEAPA